MAEERDKGVKSLNVALDVIETVAASDEDIGVTEIASRLGLTKATVFRHLQTLVERHYLAQNARTSRYRLGVQCQLLGQLSSNRVDLRSASEDAAHWLRSQTGLSVVVSAVQSRNVVVLTMHTARAQLQIGVQPGSELSLFSSAQGKIALAFGRPALMNMVKRQKWEATTPYTITDRDVLQTKIDEAREQGWADAPEELALGLNAIAAPIFDDSGECIGTIAVVALIQQLPREVNPAVTEALIIAADRVSANLGYTLVRAAPDARRA